MNIKRALSVGLLKAKKASPAVMIVAGAVGSVGALVWACVQTKKLDETVAPIKEEIDDIHTKREEDPECDEYSEKEYKKDLTKAYGKLATKTIKLYVGPALVEVASIASIVGSHRIMVGRYAALGAAYTKMDQVFKNYRKEVIDIYGQEADDKIRMNQGKATLVSVDENGKRTEFEADVVDKDRLKDFSMYSRFFDETCRYWDKNPAYNYSFVKGVQDRMNYNLTHKGYVFLNEVYRNLGMQETSYGQLVGWAYDNEKGDHYIDFGIKDYDKNPRAEAFVEGYEPSILLDFNVDGNILDMI